MELSVLPAAHRISLIQRIRDALQSASQDDEDLILQEFGIGARPHAGFEGPTLTRWLRDKATDDALIQVAEHLEVLGNTDDAASSTSSALAAGGDPEQLFLFASHLSDQRRFVGLVQHQLKPYGIRLFVAHDSIPMDARWEEEIVEALTACHGGAVFIHPGLHASYYCMQEIGWMLGRRIPIARLMFGESPKGLLAAVQGNNLNGRQPEQVAEAVIDWAKSRLELRAPLAESLTIALEASSSYNTTDKVWGPLSGIDELTDAQILRVLDAAESNSQVYGARRRGSDGGPYPELIGKRLLHWDTGGDFTQRVNALLPNR